jgi:hypothetical protein
MERIAWACKNNGLKLLIQDKSCTIQINMPLQLEYVSGDPIEAAKIIRDIEVLALDKDYYPVGEEN